MIFHLFDKIFLLHLCLYNFASFLIALRNLLQFQLPNDLSYWLYNQWYVLHTTVWYEVCGEAQILPGIKDQMRRKITYGIQSCWESYPHFDAASSLITPDKFDTFFSSFKRGPTAVNFYSALALLELFYLYLFLCARTMGICTTKDRVWKFYLSIFWI